MPGTLLQLLADRLHKSDICDPVTEAEALCDKLLQ